MNYIIAIVQLTIFGFVIQCDRTNAQMAVFNQEVNTIDGDCTFTMGCSFNNLSCRYLSYLNSSITKAHYSDLESVLDAVQNGDASGALYFTDNFTDALVARIALGSDADDETQQQSEIRVWLDKSNQAKYNVSKTFVEAAYQEFSKQLVQDCQTLQSLENVDTSAKVCINNNRSTNDVRKLNGVKYFSLCWPYNNF